MAKGLHFTFLADNQGIADLPLWVKGPKQITDGHLLGLAKKHAATLATVGHSSGVDAMVGIALGCRLLA